MPDGPPPRIVTLVLVTPDGSLLGALPPFQTEVSWWPEAWDIVRGAGERHSIDVTVLRLLETESGVPVGGRLTYLAEVADGTPVPARSFGSAGPSSRTGTLWGDAVNVASRMESHGVPGRVHVTEALVRALDGEFRFAERGTTDIKGLGEMRTYFLVGRA